jgi:RNA polymerase sigma-70 factor, ECF subfamily
VKRSDHRVGPLCKAHEKEVKSTLRRFGARGAEANDLVQNVFLAAHLRLAKLPKDAEDARLWLLDTARKLAANWRRLSRHRYEVLGCDELVRVAVAEPEDPEVHLALRDLVLRALDQLDEPERRILVAHHVSGKSLSELREECGVTRSGAHAQLRRAESVRVKP